MPNRGHEGSGKHPHKSTSEPFPHTKDAKGASGRGREAGGRSQESSKESSDLKSREYRGADGQIHHHTRSYERDHPKK